MVLDAAIKRGHFVSNIVDGNTRTEQVRREDDAPVFEANLRILELVTVWLLLSVLIAPREMGGQPGRYFLVVFEVAKTQANSPVEGVQTREVETVSKPLLSWAALTPNVLRLLPIMAI